MPEPDFYLDEFIKELGLETCKLSDGFSTRQFAEKRGCSISAACRLVRLGVKNNKLELVGKAKSVRGQYVPIYRTKKKDKK